jgi:peptidoglycan/xylan/chitin deacetylase (PgdA/CDA1 family)
MDRRTFITSTTAVAVGLATNAILPKLAQGKETMDTPAQSFWPDGARLVISVFMQFETGSQPDRGAGSPFPPLDPKYPDLPGGKWYEYGFKEGVPRLLDMWDRVGIKVTSQMVGQAVERHPELAKEMSISTHDRISGIPERVKLVEDFIKYAQKQKGVVFMRKDEIAKWALSEPSVPHEA